MRQFVADAPKAHESLSTARREEYLCMVLPYRSLVYSSQFSALALFEMTYFYENSRIIGIDSIDKP